MSDTRKPITLGQQINQSKGLFASWLIGTLLLLVGIVCLVVFFSVVWGADLPEEAWKVIVGLVGLGLIAFSFVAKIPFYVLKHRNMRQRDIDAELSRQKHHQKEMDRIRKSMTPAEWELYQVQLENQKLLREIKNKPNTSGNGPRPVYGITTDPFD